MISSASGADLSLPLDGYYRTGKYMPVRFEASPTELRLVADGAITTEIQNPTGGVAPFLIFQSPVRNSLFSQSLHELQPDEKLVGYAIDAPGVTEKLFPGERVIPLRLDPTNPLPGMGMCWQSLDAAVLDSDQFQQLADWQTLLSDGITLIVRDSAAPDADWPWKHENGFWVLTGIEPPLAIPSDGNYIPVAGWNPGKSAAYRRVISVAGIVFAILVVAISLWRSRWRILLAAIFVASAMAMALNIGHFQPELAEASGRIDTAGPYRTFDTWGYDRAMKDGEFSNDYLGSGLVLPMLPSHGGPKGMTLFCNKRGTPIDFHYRMSLNCTAAFLTIFASVGETGFPSSKLVTSPLRSLLASNYPGLNAVGEYPQHFEENNMFLNVTYWPTLLLANSDAIPK